MAWRKTKWVIHDMLSLNLSSIFLLKSHAQNYYLTSSRKRIGDWVVCPTILLKAPQNRVICIKSGPINFAQVTTILGSLYWKYCQWIKKNLMKYLRLKFFLAVIWILQSGLLGYRKWYMIYVKKYDELAKHIILSNLISNTINLKKKKKIKSMRVVKWKSIVLKIVEK